MEATLELIKELREKTGAGLGAVKEALASSNNLDEAVIFLREKGLAKATKRAEREASQGILGVYKHNDNRMAVIVEVATETDFAAKSEAVLKFANDIALHIAAVNTQYLNVESIPEEILKVEKEVASANIPEGKPAEMVEKIIEGRLEKFYKENVLMYQMLFPNEEKSVADYLNELVAKVGEKIEISRFVRMQIAQPAVQCNVA